MDLDDLCSKLSKEEKQKLHKLLNAELFPEPSTSVSERFREIREARFHESICCPRCGSYSVKRNGTFKDKKGLGRQRYLCHDCHRTFTDLTLTPLAHTHYPEKWPEFCGLMIQGTRLKDIAATLRISASTAFYWRHKVLFALRELGFDGLSGIVESDETYFLESKKGSPVMNRKPRKRGGTASKRGLSKEQICVMAAVDRQGHIFAKVTGRGQASKRVLAQTLGDYVTDAKVLCSDSAGMYKAFARDNGLEHQFINPSKRIYKKGIYHIQNVNSYHSRLKEWMRRFKGVATCYLNNYLYWFRFLELNKRLPTAEQKKRLLLAACTCPFRVTVGMVRPGYDATLIWQERDLIEGI